MSGTIRGKRYVILIFILQMSVVYDIRSYVSKTRHTITKPFSGKIEKRIDYSIVTILGSAGQVANIRVKEPVASSDVGFNTIWTRPWQEVSNGVADPLALLFGHC